MRFVLLIYDNRTIRNSCQPQFSTGNLGITFIIVATAAVNGFLSLDRWLAIVLTALLAALFAIDAYAHVHPSRKMAKLKINKIDFASLSAKVDP